MLGNYETWAFEHEGRSKRIHARGTGPGVILLHELPGITPEFVRFSDWLVEAGFRTYMPDLFGQAGRPATTGYVVRSFLGICLSREFSALAAGSSGVLTGWLRALARHVQQECGNSRVGAVGMCLTGHFALALMMEPCVGAAVLSQPSLPLPLGARRRAALHAPESALRCAEERCRAGMKVIGLRFRTDRLCPADRFETLRRRLGDAFIALELDPADANPASPNPMPHGVLTTDLVDRGGEPTKDAALRVIGFLQAQLPDPRAR